MPPVSMTRAILPSAGAYRRIKRFSATAPERDRVDPAEVRVQGRAAVPAVALGAGAGDAGDDAGREVDLPDAVVEGVGDVERAVRTDQQVMRAVELRLARRPAVAGEA